MFACAHPVRCLLVGLDGGYHATAEAVATLQFPETRIAAAMTLQEAASGEFPPGLELLVLAHPSPADLAQATLAQDKYRLPRYAIVVLGNSESAEGAEFVSEEEWREPILARVFRFTMARHQLRRETAQLKGDLQTVATRIMHDLRAPLGGILAAGEALKEIVAEHAPAEVALANPLFDSVEDLKRLTQRVSLLAKASVGPALKAPVQMGDIVVRVLQGTERQILRKGATIGQPEQWPEVEGVAPWLETIWANLVINALQHGRSECRMELGWTQTQEGIRFWLHTPERRVSDDKLPNLFQPFHLLHQANAATGLGLSIVQRLVELQGGDCGHEFSNQGGSLFFFTLPTSPSATPTARVANN